MSEILLENDGVICLCPVCDWAVPGFIIDMRRMDSDCPGCGTRKYSEFVPTAGFDRDEPLWRK